MPGLIMPWAAGMLKGGAAVAPTATLVATMGGSFIDDDPVDYTSVNFGTADADRLLVGLFHIAGNNTFTSVTIGGVTATEVDTVLIGSLRTSIYAANVPTGTSGTVSLNLGSNDRAGGFLYRLTHPDGLPVANLSDKASTLTSTNGALSDSLSCPAGNVGLVHAAFDGDGGVTDNTTWSGVTKEGHTYSANAADTVTCGQFSSASSLTVGLSGHSGEVSIIWATFAGP